MRSRMARCVRECRSYLRSDRFKKTELDDKTKQTDQNRILWCELFPTSEILGDGVFWTNRYCRGASPEGLARNFVIDQERTRHQDKESMI